MDNNLRQDPGLAEQVCCAGCGREIDEDEAQAQRWGWWFQVGELYPFCPECAAGELGDRAAPSSKPAA